ncbi:hypothetical protein [Williamsoniiplasma luminosum]|uniref:Uncharacterized protein n=1 Tax=Williamsoniiplasma luminosum TaxID=214888 RepID=A0A2S0NJD6_9MOLU|nr:hypothetical protein [Williamsoniiplasma luminosum]AVP49121.1 MAG: hypothetical protein C5T88_00785 [Williamsoniiplasma luminosum]
MKNNNPKFYTRLKYLATISSTLLSIWFVLLIIGVFKNSLSWTVLIAIGSAFAFITLISLAIYFYLRFKFMHQSQYEHTKKDLLKWSLAMISYSLGWLFAIINLMVILAHDKISILNLKIILIVMGIIMLIFFVLASILEMMSRINEHSFFNQQEYKMLQEQKKRKKKDIISNEILSTETHNHRTKEAEIFLKKNNKNPFTDENNRKEGE